MAAAAVVSASLFVVLLGRIRAEERACEWECPFNVPAFFLLILLAAAVVVCVVTLVVMFAIWLLWPSNPTDDDS